MPKILRRRATSRCTLTLQCSNSSVTRPHESVRHSSTCLTRESLECNSVWIAQLSMPPDFLHQPKELAESWHSVSSSCGNCHRDRGHDKSAPVTTSAYKYWSATQRGILRFTLRLRLFELRRRTKKPTALPRRHRRRPRAPPAGKRSRDLRIH